MGGKPFERGEQQLRRKKKKKKEKEKERERERDGRRKTEERDGREKRRAAKEAEREREREREREGQKQARKSGIELEFAGIRRRRREEEEKEKMEGELRRKKSGGPLSPLSPNKVHGSATKKNLSSTLLKKSLNAAARVKTPKSASKKKLVSFGFNDSESKWKLTLAQTPNSQRKKREQLRRMRTDELNKAARCEALGDYEGACDALVSSKNTSAMKSLKKRLSVQAQLRKDTRGVEANKVALKLEQILNNVEREQGEEAAAALGKEIGSPTEKTAAFGNLEATPSESLLGSAKKLAAVKASRIQQEELGCDLVTTPVRRSCRKVTNASTDALESSGFAFTPNKFMLPDEGAEANNSDDSDSQREDVEEEDFAFNATNEAEEAHQLTPTFNFGIEDAVPRQPQDVLTLNTPNFPKLVHKKPDFTPRTAIAKVLATLLNNSLKEGAVSTTTAAAAASINAPMASAKKAWNSPRRTRKFLFATPKKQAVTSDVAKSLVFARKIDEDDGSIDHKVDGMASAPSDVLDAENSSETSLPEQVMEQLESFHSGLTPKQTAELMKSPVKEMIQRYEDVIQINSATKGSKNQNEEPLEDGAPVADASHEIAETKTCLTPDIHLDSSVGEEKQTRRRKSILKKATKNIEEQTQEKEKKKSVTFDSDVKGKPAETTRVTRGKQNRSTSETDAAPVRRSRRLAGSVQSGSSKVNSEDASDADVKLSKEKIMSMKVVELKAELKKVKLSTSGLKKQLQKRLLDHFDF